LTDEKILDEMAQSVEDFDSDKALELIEVALKDGVDPVDIIEKGFSMGLRRVGERFGKGEAFLTELVAAANVMEEVSGRLSVEITKSKKERDLLGRVLIGTVAGDVHSIGKNILKAMLEVGGFEVVDVGVDVPTSVFVEKTRELKPNIVGLSALMSTTIAEQREVVEALKRAGLRGGVKVMVGGAAVTEKWARDIGADAYAENASDAVKAAQGLVVRH
jgi:corrinoid protein of di/trimethylamine methyltransferase